MIPRKHRCPAFLIASALSLMIAFVPTAALAVSTTLVISQVYGGGGNAGTTYRNDFVEIFNLSTSSVSLTGWTVQYTSSGGTTWQSTPLTGTVAAGGYYLVQEAQGAGGTTPLPTPDAIGTIAMSATAGKVALVNNATLLTGSGCPIGASVVDFVGYGGPATTCSETTPFAALTNTTAALRSAGGCVDTDNNSTNFASGAPAPRNSASAANPCSFTLTTDVSPVASGTVTRDPDQATYAPGSSVLLTAAPAGGYQFVGWSGNASGSTNPLTVLMDANKSITANFAANTYTLTTSVVGSGSVTRNPDQTSYASGSSVDLTAVPASGWQFDSWSGDASGSANPLTLLMDGNKSVTATFTVTPPPPPVVISQVYGGGGNAGSTYTNDFVEIFNRDSAPVNLAGWTVQYTSSTGTTWQATALSGTIPPGGYYLVQEAQGAGGTTPLPAADATGTINMSATTGKVALVNVTTLLSGACPTVVNIADLVGYGAANCSETLPTAALTNTTAALRKASGCIDTNNNSQDFASGAPTPRNSASPTNDCQFTLDVTVAPAASGSVTRSPDQATYSAGTSVNLTAAPATGYHFVAWSGDATGSSNPVSVFMDADKSVTATFAINTYTLTVNIVGTGTVSKTPDQATYDHGTSVDLAASAGTGYHFVGWSGDASGSTSPVTVLMDGNKTVTATFAINTYTLTVNVVGSGTVTKDPDQTSYDYGTSVLLTAAPASGYHFVAWSGDATGSSNPLTVVMDTDKSITATFAINTYTLNVNIVGVGSVAQDPDQGGYESGSIVTLTATAASGWHFVGWSGDASGSANPYVLVMDADKNVIATFAETPPPPAVVISQIYGGGGNVSSTYTNDFIEIFNRDSSPVDLTGWTVQYATASGATWSATPLSGSIPPGGYYLIQEAQGLGGTTPLPAADATGSISMSATSAKVALVNTTTLLTGTCPSNNTIADLVGYGAASCSETAPTAALGNPTAALRKAGGCLDSNDNSHDFVSNAPTPRNSASPTNSCVITLDLSVAGAGTATKSPDQASYTSGTLVTLAASPASGYHFSGWSGDVTGAVNPITISMDAKKVVVAHFMLNGLAPDVVISQIYGGGGNTGAPYTHDYVELFNRGNDTADITGWTLQYASTAGSQWESTTLIGTIPPGGYYLIKESQGAGGSAPLPTPQAIGTTSIDIAGGKAALVNHLAVLVGDCPNIPEIVDFVGYGNANCFKGTQAPSSDNTTALLRGDHGCKNDGNNLSDFSVGAPNPRNAATPTAQCLSWLGVGGPLDTKLELALSPNPFERLLNVGFAVPRLTFVHVRVLDLQGRQVAMLANGVFSPGRHDVSWGGGTDQGPARAGVYFVILDAMGERLVKKVAIAR